MVFISSLEIIFSKSNVGFNGVIVLAYNCGWYISDDCRQFPLRGHLPFSWQLHILSLLGALDGSVIGWLVGSTF